MNKKISAALQQAIIKYGGPEVFAVNLSKELGRERIYTRQAVENWYRYNPMPANIVPTASKLLGLRRAEIRPDLWND